MKANDVGVRLRFEEIASAFINDHPDLFVTWLQEHADSIPEAESILIHIEIALVEAGLWP